jgi:hypothetical protein
LNLPGFFLILVSHRKKAFAIQSLMLPEHKKAAPGVSLICPIRGRRGLRGMGKFPDVLLIKGHSNDPKNT